MGCTACGGTEREPVAPGYWRCTSLKAVNDTRYVPDPHGPAGQMMPVTTRRLEPCGVEYHERDSGAATDKVCSCGTFAIGICSVCGRDVCGTCSKMVAARRLCSEDVAVEVEARHQAELAEQDKKAAEAQAHADEDARFVAAFPAAMRAAGMPGAERLLRLDKNRERAGDVNVWELTTKHYQQGNDMRSWQVTVVYLFGDDGLEYVKTDLARKNLFGKTSWLPAAGPHFKDLGYAPLTLADLLRKVASAHGVTV